MKTWPTAYLIFGSIVVLAFAWITYTGWCLTSPDEVRGLPQSIRDNPGSYRTHYVGGK